ncbi:MAG: IPT/TIG domain-containing protein, partial [Streptomycetaceae bacterium]|nr:IPT/TIG domain-containing protein [Streptomycetaceae bacterium]
MSPSPPPAAAPPSPADTPTPPAPASEAGQSRHRTPTAPVPGLPPPGGPMPAGQATGRREHELLCPGGECRARTQPFPFKSAPARRTCMAPVISSISPTQGPTTGGTAVAITGSGFTGASSVKFGTASAAFTAVSSTQINATAPLGSGSVPVTVITPTGTSNSFTYTYVAAPVISSINPTQGPTAGGTTV